MKSACIGSGSIDYDPARGDDEREAVAVAQRTFCDLHQASKEVSAAEIVTALNAARQTSTYDNLPPDPAERKRLLLPPALPHLRQRLTPTTPD